MKQVKIYPQNTRNAARQAAKAFKNLGHDVAIIDNGGNLKGFNRWGVQVNFKQRETLTVKCTQSLKVVASKNCVHLSQSRTRNISKYNSTNDTPTKQVSVYYKPKSKSLDMYC